MNSPSLVPLGELPPLGAVPRKMYAQVVRAERFGEPEQAYRTEVVDVPPLGPDEVLVAVMAAGINYNGIWAARGFPLNLIAIRNRLGEPEDFHIGGSDASGIVYAVGADVENPRVGDEVVLHSARWNEDDPWILAGNDPISSSTCKIWGFEGNWGSFSQFCKVQARQCFPRPQHLSWSESAAYLSAGITIHRMLYRWEPNKVRKGDVVLIWGGAGGLGVMAIQLTRLAGGIPVAVVSSEEKGAACMRLGAEGYINRRNFDHWGPLPIEINNETVFHGWVKKARLFGNAIWDIAGKGKNPRIVIEHPGQDTLPTSLFVCAPGGMVVTCAGTSGYQGTVDLRFLWMRSKRLQGSHIGDDVDAAKITEWVGARKIQPGLSSTFAFEDVGLCHQLMAANRHPPGTMVVLVGASSEESPTWREPGPATA